LLLSQAQQPPVFRTSVLGVNVNVSVRKGNAPVQGLTAADFELTDNGVPQAISAVSLETLPVDITLLLDVSRSVEGQRLDRLKYGVLETAKLLARDDRLRLIAMQHRLREIFAFQPAGARLPVDGLMAQGGTSLVDGLAAAMMRSAEPDRRQLIVAYTDGMDTMSILQPAVAREIAGFADAVVHVLVPVANPGPTTVQSLSASSGPFLNELASRTGGQLFWIGYNAPIGDAFKAAITEFRTSYVLRYLPAKVKIEGWHDIVVRVKGGPYEVRARKGYSGS
jgi:VWFA-related protein